MGIAYTEDEIRYAVLAARPEADFLDDLNTMLLECGWERLGDFNNGSEYRITSPQGLKARCRFWSLAAGPSDWPRRFVMQMGSDVNPAMLGHEHVFVAGVTSVEAGTATGAYFSQYSVWCNCCSVFIGAVHTDPKDTFQKAVHGGVLFASGAVGDACAGEMPAPSVMTVELWWSAGDDSGSPLIFTTASARWCFRNQHLCQRYSICHNGGLFNVNMNNPQTSPPETAMGYVNERYALQLGILRSAVIWTRGTNNLGFAQGFIYPDGSPVVHNPLLIHNAHIVGEIYDAALVSRPMLLDQLETISASGIVTNWQNYMNATQGANPGYFYDSTLYSNEASAAAFMLLRARAAETDEGNVAY